MKILFEDSEEVAIELGNSPLCQVYRSIYKNLQHVPVPYRDWDNPFWVNSRAYPALIESLAWYGRKVGVDVDQTSCLASDQDYYNYLHKIYEISYNSDQMWLDFHEHIHLCEYFYQEHRTTYLSIDYRNLSGMLERLVEHSWTDYGQTEFLPGDVFVAWSELGKSPYTYWNNREPEDLSRMCQLAKPWLTLKPKLLIATEPVNLLANKDIDGFNLWWPKFQSAWCRHWNIPAWTIDHMYSGIPLGRVGNIDHLNNLLKQNLHIKQVVL
jgi:hypothetical protein